LVWRGRSEEGQASTLSSLSSSPSAERRAFLTLSLALVSVDVAGWGVDSAIEDAAIGISVVDTAALELVEDWAVEDLAGGTKASTSIMHEDARTSDGSSFMGTLKIETCSTCEFTG